MQTKPFKALRPATGLAEKIACVPYDVVDYAEAAALAEGNPLSFLHVSRPEINFPAGTDPNSQEVYEQAKRTLEKFVEDGALVRDENDCVYIYRQIMNGRAQTGVVACCSVEDYGADIIRKHEKTRQDKEDDRTRHVNTLRANTGPVFVTYRDRAEIDAMVAAACAAAPIYDFTADDGIRHIVWKVDADETWSAAFSRVPLAYIADGHHRAKAAFRAGNELDCEEAKWFLAVLFPASQLFILPYNRVVEDLNGLSEEEFFEKIAAAGFGEGDRSAKFFLNGKWHELRWSVPADADPVSALDVSVLQERLLAPILGIADPRTSQRISFVGGIRGNAELERRVNAGAAIAFAMNPVTVEEMMDIADAGQIMPPKSTWFEPKLRSGLFVHTM